MKKNLLSLLLAVVLVLGLMIVATPAMATEEETTPAEPAAHSHCVCVRSEAKPADHVCDETIVWEPYVAKMTLVDGGHYYLTQNEGETRNLTGSGDKKLNITICLNGFTFRSQTPFKVQNGNTLTICDCQGGGAIRSSQAKGTGYSVWAGYNKGVVNLYSGILSGLISADYNARPVVVDGGTFNMYGGTIKNGDSGTIATGSPNVGYGGNVLVKSYQGSSTHVGTFNLFGGTIEGGKATADGGNIYVLGGALNIYGGIIKDGSAVNGGNIAANGSYIKDDQSASRKVDLTISGGTVQNGVATEKGGNIYLQNTTNGCVFAMSDNALVTGGKAAMGGNIASYQNNPTTGLTGGTISYGAAEKGGNIYVESDAKVNTFNINGTSVIGGVAKVVETGTDAEGNPTETVVSGEGGNIYVGAGSKLQIASGTVTGGEAYNGGNIYIVKNVTAEIATQITDGTANNNGGNIYTLSDLTLGAITVSGGKATVNGGNIMVSAAVLTLNGTTVTGGSANQGGNITIRDTGAQLHTTDAIIENGVATAAGGNIYTLNVPVITITGGCITGGTATNGGNIYSTHSSMTSTRRLTISGTTVANGVAENNGGNLYIAKVGVVKLENVTCDNGQAKKNGGNVYMEGNYKINFVGGTYSVAQGGRLYETTTGDDAYKAMVAQYGRNVGDTKLISEGGKRMDGNGGNICIAYSTNYVKETTDETTGETTKETTPNATSFDSTTLIGGNAVNGGALYIGNANATIENVTAKTCGGANGRVLHVAKNGVVTVKDSTLVNWGTMGATIYNNGSLALVGAVKLDKEFNGNERYNGTAALTNGIILDVTENADAMVDISALTEVANREEEGLPTVSGIAMTRYASTLNTDKEEIKLTGAGKLATGVNDTNRGFISLGSGSAYVLTEQENDLYMENALIQGFNANHNVICGGADLTAISAEAKSGVSYYTVNANLENAGVLSIDAVLNLNGKTVSGATVAEGATLYLADNANRTYDASKCGSFAGVINGQLEYITHTVIGENTLHFVTLKNEDGSYSAHRYMARVDAISLDAKNDALGYKAVFKGDEYVQAVMAGQGFNLWVGEGPVVTRSRAVYGESMTLRLKNIMANNGGEMTIYGEAFLIFNIDGQEVEATTSARTTTMKSTIKEVNKMTELNDAQKSAVYDLYAQYADIMSAWLGETNNIKDWAPVEATA